MKKRIILSLLVVVVAVTALFGLSSCFKESDDETQYYREVELELINPNTGEVVKSGDTIMLPKEKTYIEVRVKDKETGVYLTDDDLGGSTIKDSCNVNFWIYDNNWENNISLDVTYGYWLEKRGSVFDHYKISIHFDSHPSNTSYFKPKYQATMKSLYVILENHDDSEEEVKKS